MYIHVHVHTCVHYTYVIHANERCRAKQLTQHNVQVYIHVHVYLHVHVPTPSPRTHSKGERTSGERMQRAVSLMGRNTLRQLAEDDDDDREKGDDWEKGDEGENDEPSFGLTDIVAVVEPNSTDLHPLIILAKILRIDTKYCWRILHQFLMMQMDGKIFSDS